MGGMVLRSCVVASCREEQEEAFTRLLMMVIQERGFLRKVTLWPPEFFEQGIEEDEAGVEAGVAFKAL